MGGGGVDSFGDVYVAIAGGGGSDSDGGSGGGVGVSPGDVGVVCVREDVGCTCVRVRGLCEGVRVCVRVGVSVLCMCCVCA